MKLTIIPDDVTVYIDGDAVQNFDVSSMIDSNIHAVQWDDTQGHIEYKDDTPNKKITNITEFQTVVDAWYIRKNTIDIPPSVILTDTQKRAQVLPDVDEQIKALIDLLENPTDSQALVIKNQIKQAWIDFPK